MIRPERIPTPDNDRRYEQLVELAPDGILVHDGERIMLANAAAIRLVGGTHRDQLVGQPIEVFLDPPYLKAVQQQLVEPEHSVAEAAPAIRDSLRRLDGSTMEVEVRTQAFLEGDHPSVHVVIRDISERLAAEQRIRQIEEHLHRAQRMEAVGALAGGVAHEINNTMSVVLGFSEVLMRDPNLTEGIRADTRQIMRAAQRAATVTAQLLSFSRRGFRTAQVVDLSAAVRENGAVIRRLLGESRRLTLTLKGAARVRIDPRQLDQVVLNLALNARDAMPADGTLTITTEEVELTGALSTGGQAQIPAGRYGLLSMRDTGVGMDTATKARIFEPFFTTKPVGEGSGLGLAASYGIVKQNEGYISVVSTPGQGATFSIYLPLVADGITADRRELPRLSGSESLSARSTVLLVEDEPDVRGVGARILKLSGFRILEASNGIEALEQVTRHGRPDLVLSDVVMPAMGGAELAQRLRARWPDLPILFMSGYPLEELRQQGALGPDQVTIFKPFTSNGLVWSVTEALLQEHEGRHKG